jgi:hypothetical protein
LTGAKALSAFHAQALVTIDLTPREQASFRFNRLPTNVMAGYDLLTGVGRKSTKPADQPAIWWSVSGLGWVDGTFAFKASKRLSAMLDLCSLEVSISNLRAAFETVQIDPRKRISEARSIGLPIASWTDKSDEADGDHPNAEPARSFIAACALTRISSDQANALCPLASALRTRIDEDAVDLELGQIDARYRQELTATVERYERITGRGYNRPDPSAQVGGAQ